MREVNLLESFPKQERIIEKGGRTERDIKIAKEYGREFFDGERINGYGGYYYDGRWRNVVKKLQEVYGINSENSVLDIGCAKGFFLYDLQDIIPGVKVAGIDVSEYAVNHAMDGFDRHIKEKDLSEKVKDNEENARRKVLPFMIQGTAEKLPYPDASFDVVLAINTIHNLPKEKCRRAVQEMMRVCREEGNMFIQVDSYRNSEEEERMRNWVLTAETLMSADEWLDFFKEISYNGDYFWTTV